MKKYLILLPILLMSCTQPEKTPESVFLAEQPDRIVYQAQGYYNVGLVAANAYGNLPRCGKPSSPVLCSDLSIMKKVRKVDDAAHAALKEAQAAVRTPGFAESKVTTIVTSATALTKAFAEIAATLPKKEQ